LCCRMPGGGRISISGSKFSIFVEFNVSWKSRVIGFGHAELNIGDADTTEIAQLYREHIPVL
jgi:hypothetical protein